MKIWLQSYIIEMSQTKGDLNMPGFVSVFFILFIILFITIIIYNISIVGRVNKQNKTPIKQFNLDGKMYKVYSIKTYHRTSNNRVVYELRDGQDQIIGTFNSLSDILVLLNLDNFPNEDIFGR